MKMIRDLYVISGWRQVLGLGLLLRLHLLGLLLLLKVAQRIWDAFVSFWRPTQHRHNDCCPNCQQKTNGTRVRYEANYEDHNIDFENEQK